MKHTDFIFIHQHQSEFPRQQYQLLRKVPKEVFLLLRKYHIIIAGGCITSVFTNAPIKDYDLYPRNHKTFVEFNNEFRKLVEDSPYEEDKLVFVSENAVTYKYRGLIFQIVSKLVQKTSPEKPELEVEDILRSFDFTCCMGAYDVYTDEFILYKKLLEDLASRQLVFNTSSKYPICASYRIMKYEKKGYTISAGELVKLSLCIAKLEMNTYADLKEQLLGIDTLLFKELTDDLIEKNGKDAKIDYGVVMNDINDKLNSLWESEEYQNLDDSLLD